MTIPKPLADALGWAKGTEIRFEIMGKGKLKLEETGSAKPPEIREEKFQSK